jgi:hypothetical protein
VSGHASCTIVDRQSPDDGRYRTGAWSSERAQPGPCDLAPASLAHHRAYGMELGDEHEGQVMPVATVADPHVLFSLNGAF